VTTTETSSADAGQMPPVELMTNVAGTGSNPVLDSSLGLLCFLFSLACEIFPLFHGAAFYFLLCRFVSSISAAPNASSPMSPKPL
jgi:hypothetical protein